jgi:hypothetical protein
VNGFAVRLATRADDAQIRAVLRRNVMPGAMALAFTHDPSFFDAIEVEGHDAQAIVGELDGQVVGAGLIARRRVYLNGAPAEIGYLSSLRADPVIRGTTALARGYRYFRALHNAHPASFYLSTIMEENATARALLTSGRAVLPAYHEIGRYQTVAVPLLRGRRGRPPAGLRLISGREVGAAAVAAFLNTVGSTRQCYPAYTAAEIDAPTGLLRGLALDDIAVALAGDTLVGVTAGWDQRPFRQHRVAAYSGQLRWLQPALGRLLPPSGEPVRCLLAALIAVRDDDPAVFRALLRHLRDRHADGTSQWLFVGLAAHDPLLPVAREPLHLTLHSRIYAVTWDDADAVETLDGRVPYLELGSL